jgi:hypothetical protein
MMRGHSQPDESITDSKKIEMLRFYQNFTVDHQMPRATRHRRGEKKVCSDIRFRFESIKSIHWHFNGIKFQFHLSANKFLK